MTSLPRPVARTGPQRRLTLGMSIVGVGASAKAWNWPGTKWNRFADWEHYKRSAEIARSGVLDAIFVSDHPALQRSAARRASSQASSGSSVRSTPRSPEHVDPDQPLNPEWFVPREDQQRPMGFSKALYDLVDLERLTTRQIIRRAGGMGGHRLLVGTPRKVADALIDGWAAGAVSGFNVHLPLLHEDLERFVQQVVPILQAEGVFPTKYDAPTIRGRFGLPDPRAAPAAVPLSTADRGPLAAVAATSNPPAPDRP